MPIPFKPKPHPDGDGRVSQPHAGSPQTGQVFGWLVEASSGHTLCARTIPRAATRSTKDFKPFLGISSAGPGRGASRNPPRPETGAQRAPHGKRLPDPHRATNQRLDPYFLYCPPEPQTGAL